MNTTPSTNASKFASGCPRARPERCRPTPTSAPGSPDGASIGRPEQQVIQNGTFSPDTDLDARIHAFVRGWNDRRPHRMHKDRRRHPPEGQPPTNFKHGLTDMQNCDKGPAQPRRSYPPTRTVVDARGETRVTLLRPNVHNLVIAGPDGSGKTARLHETIGAGQANHVHTVEPMGGTDTWASLDTPPKSMADWVSIWRSIFLMTTLTHINAHQSKLSAARARTLQEMRDNLFASLFKSGTFKNIHTVATRMAIGTKTLQTFEERSSWEDIQTFLFRLPTRERTITTQLIDHFDQYFDNEPQLSIKVQASLAHYLLLQERATSSVHTRLTIRNVVRDYWLRAKGFDLAAEPGYIDVRDSVEDLEALFRESMSKNLDCRAETGYWVEADEIPVPQRATVEDAVSYVMRHTLLTRSDMIRMADSLSKHRLLQTTPLPISTWKRIVNQRAYETAMMELHQAASDLRSLVPIGQTPPSQDSTIESIRDMIRDLSTEIVPTERLQDRVSHLPVTLLPNMIDVLWRHRLILLAPEDEVRAYCSASSIDRWDPMAPRYRFHPALVEYCGISVPHGKVSIEYLH